MSTERLLTQIEYARLCASSHRRNMDLLLMIFMRFAGFEMRLAWHP